MAAITAHAGISRDVYGMAAANARYGGETFNRDSVFRVFGDPEEFSYHKLNDKQLDNITQQTIYQLFSGREMISLSQQKSELILIRNGSWILQYLAPIFVSREQTMRWSVSQVNIVAHAPTAPTAMPPSFSWKEWSYSKSKGSKALMGTALLRSVLDPEYGPALISRIVYGIAVSAIITLQRDVMVEAMRVAYTRWVRVYAGEVMDAISPYKLQAHQTKNFAALNKNPTEFLSLVSKMSRTVTGLNLMIVWPGGHADIAMHTKLEQARDLVGWVGIQDQRTGDVFSAPVSIDDNGIQTVSSGGRLLMAEVPNLRFSPTDPDFNVMDSPITFGQYYVQQATSNKLNPHRNRLAVQLYDLPSDSHISMNTAEAIDAAGIFDLNRTFDDTGFETDRGPFSRELLDYTAQLNANPQAPRGYNPEDRHVLEMQARQSGLIWFDFFQPGSDIAVREQHLMTSWDNDASRYYNPRRLGEYERSKLPMGVVDVMAKEMRHAVHERLGRNMHRVAHDAANAIDHTDRDLQNLFDRAGNLMRDLQGKRASRAWLQTLAAAQPGGGFVQDTSSHYADKVASVKTNAVGGLVLPADPQGQGQVIDIDSQLFGFANGPGIRTLANARPDRYGADTVNRAKEVISLFLNFQSAVGRALVVSEFASTRSTPVYFRNKDAFTAYLHSMFAPQERPLFVRATGPVVTGGRGTTSAHAYASLGDVARLWADPTQEVPIVPALPASSSSNADYVNIYAISPDAAPGSIERALYDGGLDTALQLSDLTPQQRTAVLKTPNLDTSTLSPTDWAAIKRGEKVVAGSRVPDANAAQQRRDRVRNLISAAKRVQQARGGSSAVAADGAWLRTPLTVVVTNRNADRNLDDDPVTENVIAEVSAMLSEETEDQVRISNGAFTKPLAGADVGGFAGVRGRAAGAHPSHPEPLFAIGDQPAYNTVINAAKNRMLEMRTPMCDRVADMEALPARDDVQTFFRLLILWLPNDRRTMQMLEEDGITLPFDVVYWRLSISFQMHNILLAKKGALMTNISPGYVRSAVSPLRDQMDFISVTDSMVVSTEPDANLQLVRNVAFAGYWGGLSTGIIRPEEGGAVIHSQITEHSKSVLVTLQPLTEQMHGVVHAFGEMIDPDAYGLFGGSNAAQRTFSSAGFFAWCHHAFRFQSQKDGQVLLQTGEDCKSLVHRRLVSAVAHPGPHKAYDIKGFASRDYDGTGPAGEMFMNRNRCAGVLRGLGGQFERSVFVQNATLTT